MSSPKKRSARLSKLDQEQNQNSSNKSQGAETAKFDSPKSGQSGKKRGAQHGKAKSDAGAMVPEITTAQNPSSEASKEVGVTSKKSKTPAISSTPPSAVRRSGRAPVPSSRYKDMEMFTPRKRSIASESEESDKGQEVPKKRLKKQSGNHERKLQDAEILISKVDAKVPSDNMADVSSTKSPEKTLPSPQSKTALLEMSEDEIPKSEPEDDHSKQTENMPLPTEDVEKETDEDGNVPFTVEEMIERSLQEGKIDKSDLEASSSVNQTESEEGEGAKSKVILEDSNVEPQNETKEAHAEAEVQDVEQEQIATENITIAGQHVTFEERDGKTVAIVTIPSSLGEPQAQIFPVATTEDKVANSLPITEIVSVIPNSHGGHSVITGKAEDDTVVAAPQKLTIEARQFSSLLKPKVKTTNPVTGHGRVIPRNEQQMTAIMFKSGIGSPSLTPSSSLMTISPAEEVPSQKGSIKYSLLPSLQQTTTTETSKLSSHASITPRGNQKVIIVSQKPLGNLAGTDDSTLKSPSSQAQLILPGSGGSSTLIHVKKAEGTSLSASDLECVLKALSEKHISECESISTSDGTFSVVNSEETPALIDIKDSENKELKEESQTCSTEVNEEGVILEPEGDGQENDGESLMQETSTVEVKQNENDGDEADNTPENVKKGDTNTEGAPSKNVEIASESTKLTVEAVSEDSPSENLPVESALYQALQALEPSNLVTEQAAHPENAENVVTSDLSVIGSAEVDGKSSGAEKWTVKGETIKVVDNGIEYDVRIVCQEDVAEEIIDDSTEQDKANRTQEIAIKEEVMDESIGEESGMQTSGTQTLYNTDKGSAIQRMTTVVDKDGQKKQVYYVSVFPGKGVLNRVKSNQGARLTHASWVLSENGMYCCGKCNYKTDRKANFYKHRRLHIGAKPHICPICQYKAGTSSNLKRHMGIHKDIREHKCEICGLSFRQKIHLERHIKYKHEVKSVHCPLCDYVCANEQPDLKMHIKRKHSNGKSGEMLKCPECQVEVGSKKDLKQHMKFHKDGPELKLFCKECSFVTDCQSRLRRHAAIHSKLKPFQCGVCTYRAAQKEHVLRHLRTQHKIEVKREIKKTWKSKKQPEQPEEIKTEKADFTSGDKIFACNHCTMRFAKLINLYKHLHTQHSDIMPPETSGNFYCVVCEFSTTTKKNLLVHMRRHNMTDQTPPTHVYSCVLCRYVNPKRRNLFQHMRKKHNIDISNQVEDEAEVVEMGDVIKSVKDGVLTTQVTNTSVAGVVSTAAAGAGEALTAVEMNDTNNAGDLGNLANMIKIEDLTRTGSTPPREVDDNVATLVIDTAGEGTPVQIVHAANASTLIQQQQQHSMDALEGLQALAEQAGLVDSVVEEQVTSLDQNQSQETVIINQVASAEDGSTASVVEVVNGSDHLQELHGVTVGTADVTEVGADGEFAGMELSEEQLSSLKHGDMVEMDGDLYLVEMAHDPDQPNKQILSFVPVSATAVDAQ